VGDVQAHGLRVAVPRGWDVRVYRRPPLPGENTNAVMHAANFALPAGRGDFGSGAVETMGAGDVLVMLLVYDPSRAGTGLFARSGMPASLDPAGFATTSLQRGLSGQAGQQLFFTEGGRAFCLYVVLGSYAQRARLVPEANALVRAVRVEAMAS
jgi:hypothetical protein